MREITMSNIFMDSKDVSDLIEKLEKLENGNCKIVYCGPYSSIPIGDLLRKIKKLANECYDLSEIYRIIFCQLNYY